MIRVESFYNIVLGLSLLFSIGGCSEKSTGKNETAKELNVYNWSSYIGEDTIKDFEKEFGVKVNYDNYSSNEELLAKLQTGMMGYDVIFPSDYMVKIMIQKNLLAQINFNNIPNFKNIGQQFINLPFDPQNKFSVPYQWGTSGIGVNISKVNDKIDTWDILWNENYKGRITMLDDMRCGIVPALKKLGYSINTTNPDELNKAKELMIKQKSFVKAYTSDTYMDLLKSGDSWIAYGYSGDIYQVAKDNPNIKYIIPKEGTNIWVDNICIPHNAPHKHIAELFINYILRPKVSAGISNTTWYANPNELAKQFTNPKIINDSSIYPSQKILDNCEYLHDVGEATKLYDKLWNEIKAN